MWAFKIMFKIIFYWSAMDGHSKSEVLKIFNMNKKNAIARFLFLNPPPICQLVTIFSQNGHVTYLVTYWHNIYTIKC